MIECFLSLKKNITDIVKVFLFKDIILNMKRPFFDRNHLFKY